MRDEYEIGTLPTRRMVRGQVVDQPASKPVRTVEKDASFKGLIVCDVVAVTGDGGLVVDVREDAEGRSTPNVRVAVGANGHLSYDPQKTVYDEEIALLQLLARSVVGPAAHQTGSSWSLEDTGKGYVSKTTFLVTGSKATQLDLRSEREYKVSGIGEMTGSEQGNIAYDQSKLVPRTANFSSVTRSQTTEGQHVVRTTMNLVLLEDSFATC